MSAVSTGSAMSAESVSSPASRAWSRRAWARRAWGALGLVALAACSNTGALGAGGAGGQASGGQGGAGGQAVIGGERPVTVVVPSSYDGSPTPLVVLLHGYGASAVLQDIYFGLSALAESRGFVLALPDGTLDTSGRRFWNAGDACCDFGEAEVDDVGYLTSVLDELEASYAIDPKRVFFVGHSNGGFMSYRMACDLAGRVAAVASLAGAMPLEASACAPSEPVSVLQVHGTLDETVPYEGGELDVAGLVAIIPSAEESALAWVAHDGCSASPTVEAPLDFEAGLDGAETERRVYSPCEQTSEVALWTIDGGEHLPQLSPEAAPAMIDWLLAHPKP
jgi:polyhydroxybutyrate depolymerase